MSEPTTETEFVLVPGFAGYRINRRGVLQSCLKRGGRVFVLTGKWTTLAGWNDGFGYRRVALRVNGRRRSVYKRVHELVLLAFVGPAPYGCESSHNDGSRTNNQLENLRWDTRKGNLADCVIHGTDRRGSKSPSAKLTEAKILDAKRRIAAGESRERIAIDYGVTYSTIVNALNGSKWRHVAGS